MAETPCARSASTDSRTSSSWSGTRTRPFASSRSRTPTRRRRGARNVGVSGSIARSYMRERFIRPSSSTSSKPAVVRTAVSAPFCSRMALVATVVPWMTRSTSPGLAPAMSRMRRVAAPMPSSRSFGVLGTFVSASCPSRSRATMSVKVPPMSRPICTLPSWARPRYHSLRPWRPPGSRLSPDPQGPDLDGPQARHWMLRRDLDRLIEARAVEEIKTSDPFPRLGERAIGDQTLAFAHADGLGRADMFETVAHDPGAVLVMRRHPLFDVVLRRIKGLARGIDTYEHQVAHVSSSCRLVSHGSRTAGADIDRREKVFGALAAELGGGAFAQRGPRDASEHGGGVAVQDLLARFLADLGFGERLPRPVAAELGAVGTADDAIGAIEPHSRFDRARAERVAVHVHPGLPEAR